MDKHTLGISTSLHNVHEQQQQSKSDISPSIDDDGDDPFQCVLSILTDKASSLLPALPCATLDRITNIDLFLKEGMEPENACSVLKDALVFVKLTRSLLRVCANHYITQQVYSNLNTNQDDH
jgi:hypothetical protein